MKPFTHLAIALGIVAVSLIYCMDNEAKAESLKPRVPVSQVERDSIWMETIVIHGDGNDQDQIYKICLRGQAYYTTHVPVGRYYGRELSGIAPVFKDGKPEECSKTLTKDTK